jgi:hypothetical protein
MTGFAPTITREAKTLRRFPISVLVWAALAGSPPPDWKIEYADSAKQQSGIRIFRIGAPPCYVHPAPAMHRLLQKGQDLTMFSGALLDVLLSGDSTIPAALSLEDIGKQVEQLILTRFPDSAVRPKVSSPDRRDGDVPRRISVLSSLAAVLLIILFSYIFLNRTLNRDRETRNKVASEFADGRPENSSAVNVTADQPGAGTMWPPARYAPSSPRMIDKTERARGIDVSHVNQNVRWSSILAAGYSFVFVKATDGVTFVDSAFEKNWSDSKKAGLIRGAHQVFRSSQSGVIRRLSAVARAI